LIKTLADSIKKAKPYVKFGISPFGIWRNSGSDAKGSNTNGLESYSDIYADSRKWIQQGWLDYIAPQLYWSIGFTAARYEVLTPWWASIVGNRHLYIGQGVYRIGTNTDPNWTNPSEMPKQFRLNRSTPSVLGSIHYSAKQVMKNLLGFQDSLRSQIYNRPALIPTMKWIDSIPPLAPTGVTATINAAQTQVILSWNRPNAASDGGKAQYYVVYRFLKGNALDLNQTDAIRYVSPTDTTSFIDIYANPSAFVYVVTAVDRLHNESVASNSANVGTTKTDDQAEFLSRLFPNYPNPFSDITTVKYELKQAGLVHINIYQMNGTQVAALVNEQKAEGIYETDWRVGNLKTGTYICTMSINGIPVSTQGMVIIR
jgi:Glycosyl hydrolase-like 10/Secretion system C-terminal sorting domain